MEFRRKIPEKWLRSFNVYKQKADVIESIGYEETAFCDSPLTDKPIKSHWKEITSVNTQSEDGRRVAQTLQSAVFDFKATPFSEGDKIVFEDSTELDYIVRKIHHFPSYALVTIEKG
jgi:hypothetical protein